MENLNCVKTVRKLVITIYTYLGDIILFGWFWFVKIFVFLCRKDKQFFMAASISNWIRRVLYEKWFFQMKTAIKFILQFRPLYSWQCMTDSVCKDELFKIINNIYNTVTLFGILMPWLSKRILTGCLPRLYWNRRPYNLCLLLTYIP